MNTAAKGDIKKYEKNTPSHDVPFNLTENLIQNRVNQDKSEHLLCDSINNRVYNNKSYVPLKRYR